MREVGKGHVVLEKRIGNTLIRICDDYCRDKTPEDVQKILDRIADIANASIRAGTYGKQQTK